MRISDWSSDVCSSDLRSPFLRQAEILARLAPTCRADNAKSWSISADVCVLDNSHAEQRCWLGEGRLPSGSPLYLRFASTEPRSGSRPFRHRSAGGARRYSSAFASASRSEERRVGKESV